MSDTTFNAFLQRLFGATDLRTQADLAAVLDVNRSAITQARQKNAIPDRWLLELFRRYGLNPDWLTKGAMPQYLSGDLSSAFKVIPKVQARLCAGDGSFETASAVDGYYAFQGNWLSGRGLSDRMVLMDVFGNSMAPEIKDGDTVMVDMSQNDVIAGAIYAVGIEDTIVVKRIERHPQKLVLLSDNKDYDPIFLAPEDMRHTRILGKVLWICRELR